MANKVVQFDEDERSVDEVLSDASAMGFDFVAVVGVDKEGTVFTKTSKTSDALRALGALSLARDEFVKNWG